VSSLDIMKITQKSCALRYWLLCTLWQKNHD